MAKKRREPVDASSSSSSRDAGAVKKTRLGRRAMPDVPVEPEDEAAARKARTRLAQRTYRNRREAEVNTLKERVQRLESALQHTVKSFTEFQKVATESTGLPPNVALALSKAALEIANQSNATRAFAISEIRDGVGKGDNRSSQNIGDESDESQYQMVRCLKNSGRHSQSSTDWDEIPVEQPRTEILPGSRITHQPPSSIPTEPTTSLFPWTCSQENLSFTQRYRLACVEHGVQLLIMPDLAINTIHPVLSLHLISMTIEEMRGLALQSLYRLVTQDTFGPDPAPTNSHVMFRTIEGNSGKLVSRQRKSEVKSLAFGRTRTVVQTWMPGFEGEWLEPVDVGEYLESKGVLKRSTEVGDLALTYHNTRLNVQYFIDYLAKSAVCIGPTPGVRKADVDRVLARSIEGD